MDERNYPVPRPEKPTDEETAAFELWKKIYEKAVAKGERQGWLSFHPYCDGAPEPWSPTQSYEESLRQWRYDRDAWVRAQHEREEQELQKRAAAAAEHARRRVLQGK